MIYKTYNKIIKKYQEYTFRRIFEKLGLYNINTIRTDTKKEELRTLYSHAMRLINGNNCLEIGSYLGASSCYIVAGIAQGNGNLTCVDTWNNENMPGGEHDTYQEFQKNTYPISNYISVIRKNSLELTPANFDTKFDYVFIDGDHSYNAVKSDFCLVEAITKHRAIVLFHDSKYFEGVTRTIGEALATGSWEIGGSVMNLFWIIKK